MLKKKRKGRKRGGICSFMLIAIWFMLIAIFVQTRRQVKHCYRFPSCRVLGGWRLNPLPAQGLGDLPG